MMKKLQQAAAMILFVHVFICTIGAAQIQATNNDTRPDGKTAPHLVNNIRHSKKDTPNNSASVPPLTKPLPNKERIFNSAYLDAASILSEDNLCSDFFGDREIALSALTDLTGQLSMVKLHPLTWIRMTGTYSSFTNEGRKLPYRLFKYAEVNFDGPFNWRPRYASDKPIAKHGNYWPGTRETRVLLLLHELGHLLKGKDGNWLLPDDGYNLILSGQNTALVEAKCGEQIKVLSNQKTSSLTRKAAAPSISMK